MKKIFDAINKLYINNISLSSDDRKYIDILYASSKESKLFRMTMDKIEKYHSHNIVSGTILSGNIPDNNIKILPRGMEISIIDKLITTNHSTQLVISHGSEISCSGIIVDAKNPALAASKFRVEVISLSDKLIPGREYIFNFCQQYVNGIITKIKNTDILNKKYICNIELEEQIAFDTFEENPVTGTFSILNQKSINTIALGIIRYPLRRENNIHQQFIEISKHSRSALKRQKACVLWMTGISGAGKSSIANAVEKKLNFLGYHTYLLDGDNIRHGLNRDLGFTEVDRVENIRRIAEVAHLMVDAGLIVMTAFISPFKIDREMARRLFEKNEFIEIYIKTPLEVAELRDPKGLYAKARRGEIKNFTGIDSIYEPPTSPEISIETTLLNIDEAADIIINFLDSNGIINKD